MKCHLLGETGLHVSQLCLGSMTFGGEGGFWGQIGQLKQEAVNAQLRLAFDRGINS